MLDVQVTTSQDAACTFLIGSTWWWLGASCPEIYTHKTVHLKTQIPIY
jgi:hypothetical protein